MKGRAFLIGIILLLTLAPVGLERMIQPSGACLAWQAAYKAVESEYVKRNMPVSEGMIYEETVERFGRIPPGCRVPDSFTSLAQ